MNFTVEELKAMVDGASYEELLRKNRFAPSGDPLFQGEMGEYTIASMNRKKAELSDGEVVAISKRVGWKR